MFSFAWPWMAVLLALPFLVHRLGKRARTDHTRSTPEIFFPNINRLKRILPQRKAVEPASGLYLPVLALLWLCLVSALMRPELVDCPRSCRIKRIRFDAGGWICQVQCRHWTISGMANRISGRIDIVKSVVSDFVVQRQGDRWFDSFGSNAYLHVPLTLDYRCPGTQHAQQCGSRRGGRPDCDW